MTSIERELTRVLHEHGEPAQSGIDLSALHRSIDRRRRRRQIGAVATVVLVLAIPVGVRDLLTAPDRARVQPTKEPEPPHWATPEVPVSIPMPDYQPRGAGRLIEQHAVVYERVVPGNEQTMEFAYTPDRDDMQLVVDCGGADDHVVYGLQINGHDITEGAGCASERAFGLGWGEHWRAQPRPLQAGTEYRITVTLSYSAETSRDAELYPPDVAALEGQGPGELSVGFYRRVPFDEYVFPPQPAELMPFFRDDIDGPIVHRFSTSESGFNGTFTRAVTAPTDPNHSLQVFSSLVGPGKLRVLVDGREVDRNTSYAWSHTFYGTGVPADPGQQVEVTIIAEGFLAPAWEVTVFDAAWGGCGTDGCGGK